MKRSFFFFTGKKTRNLRKKGHFIVTLPLHIADNVSVKPWHSGVHHWSPMQREVYTVLARSSFVHTFFSLTPILIRIPAFGVASSGRKERNRKFLFKYLPTRIRGSVVFFSSTCCGPLPPAVLCGGPYRPSVCVMKPAKGASGTRYKKKIFTHRLGKRQTMSYLLWACPCLLLVPKS